MNIIAYFCFTKDSGVVDDGVNITFEVGGNDSS